MERCLFGAGAPAVSAGPEILGKYGGCNVDQVRAVGARSSLLKLGLFLFSYVIMGISAYAHEALDQGIENETESIHIYISEDILISDVTNKEYAILFPGLGRCHALAIAYIGRKRPTFLVWSIVTCGGPGQELRASLCFRVDCVGHSRTGFNRPDSEPIDEESGSTSIIDDLKPKLLTSEADQEATGWIYPDTSVDNLHEGERTFQFNERTFGHACGALSGFRYNSSEACLPSRYDGKHYCEYGYKYCSNGSICAIMQVNEIKIVFRDVPNQTKNGHTAGILLILLGPLIAVLWGIYLIIKK